MSKPSPSSACARSFVADDLAAAPAPLRCVGDGRAATEPESGGPPPSHWTNVSILETEQAGIDARTATRDFRALSDLGLLRPVGETKGRHYVGGPALEPIRAQIGRRPPLDDPYPWMPAALAEAAAR